MDLSRPDIDSLLESIDAEIAGAPEGGEHDAYALSSQIFFDLLLADGDIPYVARRLQAIAVKYELAVDGT